MRPIIKKKLEEWLNHHLIDEKTYLTIKEYEEKQKEVSSKKLILWVFLIAGFSIGLGIISIVAANWELIPAFLKFIFLLGLHGAFGFLYLWFYKKHKNIFVQEILLVIFAFLFLAEIALTAQVFQLQGETYQALFFWGFLMLFVSSISEAKFLPMMNFIVLYVAISLFFYEAYNWNQYVIFDFVLIYLIVWGLFYVFYFFSKNSLLVKINPIFWGIFYVYGIFVFQFEWYANFLKPTSSEKYLHLFLVLFAMIIILYDLYNSFIKNYQSNKKIYYLFFINYIIFLSNYLFIFNDITQKLLGTSFFLLQCFLSAFLFYLLEKKNLYRFFIFLILLRLFIIYIELFEDLTFTGIGLIGLGLTIVLLVFLYKFIEKRFKYEK
jgi:uncharacterized membrane protein